MEYYKIKMYPMNNLTNEDWKLNTQEKCKRNMYFS